MRPSYLGAIAVLAASPAFADVKTVTPQGFEVGESVTVHVPLKQAFAALEQPQRWWSAEHTLSGNAANLSLSLRPNGCFCERLKDGGWAKHMDVTLIQLDSLIEMHGGLGPLRFEGVAGTLQWSVRPDEHGTIITQSYVVGGYMPKGGDYWAQIVDRVLQEQLTRLASYLNTGSPTPKKSD